MWQKKLYKINIIILTLAISHSWLHGCMIALMYEVIGYCDIGFGD